MDYISIGLYIIGAIFFIMSSIAIVLHILFWDRDKDGGVKDCVVDKDDRERLGTIYNDLVKKGIQNIKEGELEVKFWVGLEAPFYRVYYRGEEIFLGEEGLYCTEYYNGLVEDMKEHILVMLERMEPLWKTYKN